MQAQIKVTGVVGLGQTESSDQAKCAAPDSTEHPLLLIHSSTHIINSELSIDKSTTNLELLYSDKFLVILIFSCFQSDLLVKGIHILVLLWG